MEWSEYIRPELLVLIPVLYLIGVALKKSQLSDRWIPLVLGGISVALAAVWVFATSELGSGRDIATAAFTAVTQGVLAAGASVYANQIYKQTTNKEE